MTTTSKLAAALVAARRKFGPALKDKANPAFRSKYADLGACLDAVDDALLEAGIAVTQETFEDDKGVTVETVLIHESGEERRFGKLHVPAAKHDPQGFGSALTYARRYSLMAACGIAPEDDDANAATKAHNDAKAKPGPALPGGAISATKEAFTSLGSDWQEWLTDTVAPKLEAAFKQDGAAATQTLLDAFIKEDKLEAEHIAGLWYLLDSKTRSALRAQGQVKRAA